MTPATRAHRIPVISLISSLLLIGAGISWGDPPASVKAAEDPASSTLPPLPEVQEPRLATVEAAITRGVDYLISSQNANGSWGSATRTKGLNIYAPIPGAHHAFRTGASGLALQGLLESGDRRPETMAAIEKAEAWFLKELPRLRRADLTTTYNVWGHAYALRAFSTLYEFREGDPEKRARIKKLAADQLAMLVRYEDVDGGWGYLDLDANHTRKPSGLPTSFTTATVLVAMHEAREAMDLALPEREVGRGVRSIQKQRAPDFSYVYSLSHQYRPRYYINRPAGSLARSQVCNAALRYFGDEAVTDDILRTWIERFVTRNGWIDIARKRPIPHETHFANSGYFYYYGFYYATDCIDFLPGDEHAFYHRHLARILLEKQEKDGSWWDYPLYTYHQPYGTGYVLTALGRARSAFLAEGAP